MKLPAKLSAALVSLLALSATAFGGTLKINTSAVSNGSSGGSYTITLLSGDETNSGYSATSKLSDGTFEGFCLEPGEYFTSGGTYDYTIGNIVYGGGANSHGGGPGDPLSVGTAWLYSQFALGTLANFDYSLAGRKSDNLELQFAFWNLEDEGYSLSANYQSLLIGQFGSIAAAQQNAEAGAYGVWALNLTSTDSKGKVTQHQSQLFYQTPPTVPDNGATLALIGAAFLSLGLVRRKLAK